MATLNAQREQKIVAAIRTNGRRLFGFIRGRVRSDEDAEDILQDVWLSLSSVIDIEPIEQLSAWLYRVARNRIIDRRRKKRALTVSEIFERDDNADDSIEDVLFTDPETPESVVVRKLLYEEMFRALEELPEPQRQIFIWNEIEGRTFQSIADETGENIKTLISRKRYAVSKLRAKLADLQDELSGD